MLPAALAAVFRVCVHCVCCTHANMKTRRAAANFRNAHLLFLVVHTCTHDKHKFVLDPLVLIHAQMNTWQAQPVIAHMHTRQTHAFVFISGSSYMHTQMHYAHIRLFSFLGFDTCTHEHTAGAASFAYMCDTQIPLFSFLVLHACTHAHTTHT